MEGVDADTHDQNRIRLGDGCDRAIPKYSVCDLKVNPVAALELAQGFKK